jgi:hypothetical protein
VLKGGTLLAAYHLRRATRDIDVQALDLPGDADTIADLVRQVCAVESPHSGGLPAAARGSFPVTGYPLASVLSENLVRMLELGGANTRDWVRYESAAVAGDRESNSRRRSRWRSGERCHTLS